MSKISVALCTYNGAKFLPEQLESYTKQTRLPDELIVCDDNSIDETTRVIEDFAQTAPFPVSLRVNETNIGSTRNFERAIALCTGDLIFLSDQDDVWLPDKIRRMETEFSRHKEAALIFSDAALVDENLLPLERNLFDFTFPEESRKKARAGNFFEILLRSNVVTGATMAFRGECRKIFMPVPDTAADLIHDGWISLVIAASAEVLFIEEPLVKYRQHSNQQIGIDLNKPRLKDDNRNNRYAADVKFSETEIARLKQLKDIFAAHPQFAAKRETICFEDLIKEKREQIAHHEARMSLPSNRFKRLLPICREVQSGRYRRFSKGFLSAAKDLLQKW